MIAGLKGAYDSRVSVHVQIRNQRTEEFYFSCCCTAWSKCAQYYVDKAILKKRQSVMHNFQSFADDFEKKKPDKLRNVFSAVI